MSLQRNVGLPETWIVPDEQCGFETSPHLLVAEENAAKPFCCEAPEMFARLRNFI